MATDTQQYVESQYRLPLFGYITTCAILLIACRIFMGDATAVLNLEVQHSTAQDLQPTPADPPQRTSPIYWITGEGGWAPKWEYTNHDIWLAVVSILANLWMGWEYYRYASACGAMCYRMSDGIEKTHMLQLRRVFLQCVVIHAGMGVLLWWLPAYWLLTVLVVINAKQTRRLNTTKIQMLRAISQGSVAEGRHPAITPECTRQLATHNRLDQARDTLMQRVPYAGE